MKKLLIILLSALSLTAYAQNKSVAILNPLDREGSVSSMYKIIVRSSFETVASVTQGYEAFDRTALDAIMSEHNFQRSGAVNDAEIRQIGQMAGVDYVLVTEVSAENEYIMVQAKILNVITAKYDRAVDDLMQMTPPSVKEGCTILAQKLFRINLQTGNQKGEILYEGNRYVGEYRDGMPNGKGKLYYSGDKLYTYEGEFTNGKRHGYGTLVWQKGHRYEGKWMDDKREGFGNMFWSNGDRFEGEWVSDRQLTGTMFYANGEKYVGNFDDNGKRSGKATYYYPDGKRFVGIFLNDNRNGRGTMYLSNGEYYETYWKDGIRNGTFVYHVTKEEYEEGTYVSGKREGDAKYYFSNGYEYGKYVNGKRDGIWVRVVHSRAGDAKWKATYSDGKKIKDWH